MALDWSLKSIKRHRCLPNCNQGKKIRGKMWFCKEYYIWDCTPQYFNFNKYFVRIIFLLFCLNSRTLWNLCVQIFGTLDGTFLPLISFIRRLIIITLMASKKTQVVHVNKGSDKIIITQSTHNTATSPMTCSKVKSTSSLSTKQTSEPIYLLKPIKTRDEHQPFITLASSRARSHNPHSRGKLPSALKDFRDKSPYSVIDAFQHQLTLQITKWNVKEGKLLQSFQLFYFSFIDDHADNDNIHYVCRETIGRDGSHHCQTHHDDWGEGYANSLPHKQGRDTSTKYE